MIQLKIKLLTIAALGLTAVILARFNNNQLFDGGTVNYPNIVITANTRPPEISATNASGCGGAINYQRQQSADDNNFINIPNATTASYQPLIIITTIQFLPRSVFADKAGKTEEQAESVSI